MINRFGWALADQVLSSATNFALSLLVARTVGARDLGAFSVAYATFTFSLGAVRAIAGELLAVRHSAVSAEEWREAYRIADNSRFEAVRKLVKIAFHPIKPGTNGTARYLQRIARGEEN